MSDENQVIAEWLDAHDHPDLAWEPAWECPQGHPNVGRSDDERTPIGEACSGCLMTNVPDTYRTRAWEWAASMNAAMADHPELQPEWRIGRVPHNFTLPEYLLPALEAFSHKSGWMFVHEYLGHGCYRAYFVPYQARSDVPPGTRRWEIEGKDARRESFAAALTQKGSLS